MLILTRREWDRIKVGDEIEITVTRISGDRVQLGIAAPDDVAILRSELEPHPRPDQQEAA